MEYLISVPSEEEEKRWYYKHIFKKMLVYDCSKRSDFIELYYSVSNKNRKNVSNHILFDFLISQNLLEKYMFQTKGVIEEVFSTLKNPDNNEEKKKKIYYLYNKNNLKYKKNIF